MTWPVPALLAWGSSWLIFKALQTVGLSETIALVTATFWGGFLSKFGSTTMRKALIVLGFPLSMLVSSSTLHMPPLAWLMLLGLIVLVYPRKAWRDAPLFPTPKKALKHLPDHITLLGGARILDAGSGMGDGLIALRDAYPRADLNGLEMSWPLRILSAMRCSFARIRQGDIWLADWRSYDLVYLFQRPESMPRAVEKAEAEMRRGAWLVSLEFEARELVPHAVVYGADGRPVWMYQVPFKRRG
ncbi:class I SAM-dependent methyltransferase [Limnohabitans sp. TS-CS-82]|uniref:class I SAM-dependent methyltransferase n=1 Tax=Limnohabitans sp. TS-CS-82 TaxID=2094193 RepID=UPI001F23EFD1|nr:class I SAM-dependent methyltransferase [Limnohabitans sp. TS-CS-82]